MVRNPYRSIVSAAAEQARGQSYMAGPIVRAAESPPERIGYFGGSFDPPHRGHLAVARAARDRFGLQQVLLAPTGKQPLKPAGPAASFKDRLQMTALLCRGERGLVASDLDAPRPDGGANYTVDTLRVLDKQSPGARLFAIVGADAFLGLPKWKDMDALFACAEWVVVSRPGFDGGENRSGMMDGMHLTPVQRERVHMLSNVHDPTSATELRARLRAGLPCDDLLPPAVLAYIRDQALYRG